MPSIGSGETSREAGECVCTQLTHAHMHAHTHTHAYTHTHLCTPVFGQSALTAMPCGRSSSAMPNTHMDMPYLAMVYAKRETAGQSDKLWKMTPLEHTTHSSVWHSGYCSMHKRTTVVLKPDCFHVQGRTDVQDVCIGTLLQVRQTQF